MENERQSQPVMSETGTVSIKLARLVLASTSPRRAEILRSVGWEFTTYPVDIDETLVAGEPPVDYVERLAREKAESAAGLLPGRIVLAADTTVVVDGVVLAKPEDEEDARRMLKLLSGRWHEVLTGVALIRVDDHRKLRVAHEITRVLFTRMSDEEIKWYVASGEPMGKAGAYGIQGRAALFVEKIEGDYWNVVGLPVRLVYKLMRELSR